MAYSGSPIALEEILFKPKHSLIDQSLHSTLGVETTNGDGFGVGWYIDPARPGVFRGTGPAWNNRNLANISHDVTAPIFLAHIRSSTGTPVQESNCHPFRFENWLWMHNGSIAEYPRLRRDLMMAIAPELFPAIEGSTDSEMMFFLALTFGLRDDAPRAVERAVGFIEAVGRGHGVEHPVQMTVATSDGDRLWAFRYSTARQSRSLFYSTDVHTLRALHPDNPILQSVSEETRLVVSEPLGALPGAWNEVPESSYGVIQDGQDLMAPFQPVAP
jgi:glutamine amidotransferase